MSGLRNLARILGMELRRRWIRMRRCPERLQMSVQKTVPVGQKAVATMLQVNGELLLLGVTSGAVTLIHRWEQPEKALRVEGSVQ